MHEGSSARKRAEALREVAAKRRAEAERAEAMASHWEAGELGERRVAEALGPLEGDSCHILHDRLLNPDQSRVNLDHIVICVAGTYLIDAKNWSGRITASSAGLVRTANGRTRPMNRELDKVRQMAEQMELATSTVIEPVLCLAGDEAALFGEPTQVRGVFVVPVDRLASWLTSRPRAAADDDLRTRTVKIAASFPSATEPAFLAMPPRRRQPQSARQQGAVNLSDGRSRKTATRAPRSRQSRMTRPLVVIGILLLLITPIGKRLFTSGSSAAGGVIAHQLTKGLTTAAPAKWTAPCTGVTDAQIASTVGRRVYRYENGGHDICSWGFVPRPTATAPGDITIATGWWAKNSYSAFGSAARYVHSATSESLLVPQFTTVPGSTLAASRITQPIAVIIAWPTLHEPATVKKQVTLLAAEVTNHLPSGPGS